MNLAEILEISMQDHDHLCPRQILGARIGMAGMKAFNFTEPPQKKELLIISETDGCFVDGVIAATGCTVGHRTLRVEDYGKVAVTFVDVKSGKAIRVAPTQNIREQAILYASEEPRHYFAQMQAYQIMADNLMFTFTEVKLTTSIQEIVSHPGMRVNCDMCGEEIMNEREIKQHGYILCRACAKPSYYQPAIQKPLPEDSNSPVYAQ
jgi:formylmethanofuran dehydrogenase subunit E